MLAAGVASHLASHEHSLLLYMKMLIHGDAMIRTEPGWVIMRLGLHVLFTIILVGLKLHPYTPELQIK